MQQNHLLELTLIYSTESYDFTRYRGFIAAFEKKYKGCVINQTDRDSIKVILSDSNLITEDTNFYAKKFINEI